MLWGSNEMLYQKWLLWLGSSVGWSVVLLYQGYVFNPPQGTYKKQPNEWINNWNNKLMILFLFLPPSLFFPSSLSLKINQYTYFKVTDSIVI